MSALLKSVFLAACLLVCHAFPQSTPSVTASASTPSVTASASVPTGTTTTSAPGWLGSWIRPMVNGGASAVNSGLDLAKDSIQFKSSMANRGGQGMIGISSSLSNMGLGMASDSLTFGTGLGTGMTGIAEGVASMVPFAPIGAGAKMGGNLMRIGLNGVAAGGNMGIGVAQTIASTKHNLMSSGLSKGTGLISSVGSMGVQAGQAGVSKGAEVTNQVVDSFDSVLGKGYEMAARGGAMANNAISQASSSMQGIADQAKKTLDANIAATLPGASATASVSG